MRKTLSHNHREQHGNERQGQSVGTTAPGMGESMAVEVCTT